jgi:2,3-bisphosphoglycerate-dependent phosphoglycerate mutase
MRLILIKHARPLIDPVRAAHEWKLSDQGRGDASRLAERLRPHAVEEVFSSDEPKAIETAQIIAAEVGVDSSVADGVHEHDRSNVPHMRSGEFISHVELFFRKPDELTLGRETANQCLARFEAAIDELIRGNAGAKAIAVVTHGTVLSLYLANLGAGKPFDLWRRMGLPSYAVIESSKVVELIEKLDV